MVEWWESFFAGPWIDVQAKTWSPRQSAGDAAVIEGLLKLSPASTVLDVPCGEGRISRALGERGHVVTGVDLSERLLARARATSGGHEAACRWLRSDMRGIDFDGEFEAAVCWWGSFGYFDDTDNLAFLRATHRALRRGGRVLIDVPVLDGLLPHFQPRSFTEVDGTLVLEDRSWDVETGRMEVDWTFVANGQTHVSHTSMRIFTYAELRNMLREAGFETVQGFDPATGAAFAFPGTGLRCAMVGTKA